MAPDPRNPKIPNFLPRRAIAMFLGEDEAEVENEHRYQPTRTPCPVYSVGNDYYAATRGKRAPKSESGHGGGDPWNWVAVPTDSIPADFGWTIWRHVQDAT
jgi:hypothetical protein